MTQMRRAAPYFIVFACYCLFGTMTLYATENVLTMEAVKTFFYETLAAVLVTAVLMAGGLVAWVLARDREINGKRLERMESAWAEIHAGLRDAIKALEDHNGDEHAHPEASEHNHAPMNKKMDVIEAKLDQLIMEHKIINAQCPANGIRRSDDPPLFDGRTVRGHK